jgi:hypothetical protein
MSPFPITSAHPLIPVLSYLYPLTIKPDEKRKNNWTKVSHDTSYLSLKKFNQVPDAVEDLVKTDHCHTAQPLSEAFE